MFGGPPADYQPSESELDMHARLLPTPEQIEGAKRLLANCDPRVDCVYVALAAPGADRFTWTVGQPIEHIDGAWLDRNDASLAACAQLGQRDGMPYYAAVWRDGVAAVFPDIRWDRIDREVGK
jgi:hypothetical protein